MGRAGHETKQRLVDTALELIWKSSYGAVSVDDICKAADVKKGSFYHFFPSKVHLAIAAMEESFEGIRGSLDNIFSPSRNPVERFELFADFIYQHQLEIATRHGQVCGCPRAALGSELAGQEESVRATFDQLTRRMERYFENALRDMIAEGLLPAETDVKGKAQEIYAYVMGHKTLARIQNDLEPMKRELKPGLLQLLGVKKTLSDAA